MRLVAAAKVRRAQEQVLRSRPFADRLARIWKTSSPAWVSKMRHLP